MKKIKYKCEVCDKEICFPNRYAIQFGVSNKFYYFRKYKNRKIKIMKIATYCSKKCYKIKEKQN